MERAKSAWRRWVSAWSGGGDGARREPTWSEPLGSSDWRWSHPKLALLGLFESPRSPSLPFEPQWDELLGRRACDVAGELWAAGALRTSECLAWECSPEALEALAQWRAASLALRRATMAKCERLLERGLAAKALMEAEMFFKGEHLAPARTPSCEGELGWMLREGGAGVAAAMEALWGEEGVMFLGSRAGDQKARAQASERARQGWRKQREAQAAR